MTLTGFDHQLTIRDTAVGVAIVLIYAGVALLIARRQPRNPIGWLLLIFTVLYVLGAGATLQAPALALFPPVILLFPDGRLTSRRWRRVLWAYAALVGLVALPAGIGVGILKYRLYDIDRIISRTLAYAIITGLLIGVYAALVLLATQVFRFHTSVAVAAATLAAAALFAPVRRRVQQAVDRRFNRARYDADQTVAAFAARLQDAVNLDSARADLASVVTQALEPAHVSVWINERG